MGNIVLIGAWLKNDSSCDFTVWAPLKEKVELKLNQDSKLHPMKKDDLGYWKINRKGVSSSTSYQYKIDDNLRPDPASFFQPNGPHQASLVVDHTSFNWQDTDWLGLELKDYIIYELHVGTFTDKGTLNALIEKIGYLKQLGINAIELMPVAQFSGERNWGYDGTYLFSVQNSYGGPLALKRLVNACHGQGIAVILDVVYNHFGPEGNYLSEFGPYLTDKYKTPWGKAVNFDDAYCCGVRNFVISNALYWFEHFHIDALRLDAIHGIFDFGAKHILKELAENTAKLSKKLNRKLYLFAESDLNDTRVISDPKQGGLGLDSQWLDDFHHSVHTLVTNETKGYYADFGKMEHLVKALNQGFVYSWDYSKYRKKPYGSSSSNFSSERFVIFLQNHDQVGNRMLGDRLVSLVSFETLKLAAGLLFTSGYIPLIFMGDEYAEDSPFLYFVSHSDEGLIKAVKNGRINEFKDFNWVGQPPDPIDPNTFAASKVSTDKHLKGEHKIMFDFYTKLINLRKHESALGPKAIGEAFLLEAKKCKVILNRRCFGQDKLFIFMNFSSCEAIFKLGEIGSGAGKLLSSSSSQWLGSGDTMPEVINSFSEYQMPKESFCLYKAVN